MNCPHCNRLLYNRSHRLCGYCGLALPDECLFPPDVIAKNAQEMREIDRRMAALKAKREAEAEQAQRAAAAGGASFFVGI